MKRQTIFLGLAFVSMTGAILFSLNYEKWVTLPKARKAFAAQLRDPDSTQFRSDRFRPNGWLCGEVNGKNGSGGYVGFRRFISAGKEGTFFLEGEGRLSKDTIQDTIDDLDERIAIMESVNARHGTPMQTAMPSDSRMAEMVSARIFDKKWKEICD